MNDAKQGEATAELSTPQTPLNRWHSTFRAFELTNFRWFFACLFANFSSMNMQMFVRGWLVFEITGSYEKLGWMTAAGGLVGLVAAPLGGVVADRVRQKKHVIQVSGLGNMGITLAIALLIADGSLTFEHLLLASIAQVSYPFPDETCTVGRAFARDARVLWPGRLA